MEKVKLKSWIDRHWDAYQRARQALSKCPDNNFDERTTVLGLFNELYDALKGEFSRNDHLDPYPLEGRVNEEDIRRFLLILSEKEGHIYSLKEQGRHWIRSILTSQTSYSERLDLSDEVSSLLSLLEDDKGDLIHDGFVKRAIYSSCGVGVLLQKQKGTAFLADISSGKAFLSFLSVFFSCER